MNLKTVLTTDTVNLHLKGTTKEEIIDELLDLLEHVGNMGSDDDLELPAAMDDAHGPIERVDGVLVRCAFICKDETQPRYAVVCLADVFLAAHQTHDIAR